MSEITSKLESNKEWPAYFLPVLGILTSISFFLLTLINVFYLTKYAKLLTHVGFFQAQYYPAVVWSLFILLFILYLFFYWFVISANINKKRIKQIIIFSGIFMAILLISGPFMSADLYGYIYRAEMINTLQINPYQVTPYEVGYGNITPWGRGVMPYGPLFTIITMGLNKISGSSLALNLLIFRLFNIVLLFVCTFFIYKIIKKINPSFAYKGVALFLWNPFILVETVNNGHNDIIMLFFVLLSIYFLLFKKFTLSALMIVGSFLLKYVTIILLPIPFLMILFEKEFTWGKKIKKIFILLLTILLLLVIFYLPFGTFGKDKDIGQEQAGGMYLKNQKQINLPTVIISRSMDQIDKGETYSGTQKKITLPTLLVSISIDKIDGLMNLNINSEVLANILNIVIFIMVYFYFILKRSSSKDYVVKQVFWIIFSFMFLLTFYINVWYLIWIVPLVLLISNKKYYPLIIFFNGLWLMFYLMGLNIANVSVFIIMIIFYFVLFMFKKFVFTKSKTKLSNIV